MFNHLTKICSFIILGIFICHATVLAQPPSNTDEMPDPLLVSEKSGSKTAQESSKPEPPEEAKTKPSLSDLFIDPEDGALDVSVFLGTKKGFLPIGSLITEPAVGYGGVLGLMFLHDSIEDRMEKAKEMNPDGKLVRLPPPNISGVGGFATENGSWGGGLFHFHVFKEDKFRYTGALFYMEMDLDYYGLGGLLPLPVDSLAYTLDGYFLV